MRIQSKYDGTCESCQQPIRKGDAIEWNQGEGARHVNCLVAAPDEPAKGLEPWMFTDADPVIRIAKGLDRP